MVRAAEATTYDHRKITDSSPSPASNIWIIDAAKILRTDKTDFQKKKKNTHTNESAQYLLTDDTVR